MTEDALTGEEAEHTRRQWLHSEEAERIRHVLEQHTPDGKLVDHLLHQAAWVGRHSVEGNPLITDPESYAEMLWATHENFDAYAGAAFEEISRAAREL